MSLFDFFYAAGVTLAAPYWLVVPKARRKVFSALRDRMGFSPLFPPPAGPTLLIHAVSVGEINATPTLLRALAEARPHLHFLVTTTTATGFERGKELFASDKNVTLIRFPLDFSSAIGRMLDQFRPVAAVLMELEVWPNFMRLCSARQIPVIVVNGRLTSSSFRGYQRLKFLTGKMFAQLAFVCAQDELYAKRFADVGVPPEGIAITGTMKFDTAQLSSSVSGDMELASDLGLSPGRESIWVCGSTGPGEESILLEVYRRLKPSHPSLRVAIIPRKPERFDEVAELIARSGFGLIRRSRPGEPIPAGAIVLGDTMGELRKFYSLANVVFVGRSLVDLGPRQHGSDMIEPAALAKPVAIGPFTHNFADAMRQFLAVDAMKVVQNALDLTTVLDDWLCHPDRAAEVGRRAQQIVQTNQGATARNLQIILNQLDRVLSQGA